MTKPRLDDLIDGIRTQHPEKPLEQLTAAVLLADYLSDVSDHLIGHFVDQARRSGASWTEIGAALGVTKQAAQQRFTDKNEPNRFSRFTARARHAVVQSQEEARAARLMEVRPEHILLGLATDPDSIAMLVLAEQKVTADAIRAAVDKAVPAGPADAKSPTHIPFTGEAKRVLELTFQQALRLLHNYIGTEHMLLALLEYEAGTPGPLRTLGVDPAAVEAGIMKRLDALVAAKQEIQEG
jgi:hypothetical protein